MFKRCALFVILLSMVLTCGYSFVSGKETRQNTTAAKHSDQAFNDMIKGFELYLAFFNDSYPAGNFTISKHGDTYDEAVAYFEEGFESELAAQIVAAYTFWNPDNKKLQILPTDGLPVLVPENPNLISSYYIDEDHVIFSRYFENYYCDNTQYLYRVFCQYDGNRWKIYHLEWEPVQEY